MVAVVTVAVIVVGGWTEVDVMVMKIVVYVMSDEWVVVRLRRRPCCFVVVCSC